MTAIECTPESSNQEHPDDRIETTAHLLAMLAFFKVDTVQLSTLEWHEDYELAHEDLHRFDVQAKECDEN